jgi:outer membrane lipoprotein SlyB
MTRPAALVVALALFAAGCASRPGEGDLRHGRVARVDPLALQGDHQLGVGAVLGATAATAFGHSFATGDGRAVAQVLGVLGASYAGGTPEEAYPARRPGEHVTVTLGNGVAVGVAQLGTSGLRAGDCVRVEGAGEAARIVRAACVGPAPKPVATPQGEALQDELRERIRERMARDQPPAPVTPGVAARSPGEAGIRFGRVVRADAVVLRAEHELGLEGVMNGVSGAAFGNPVPGGDGRAFADVASALGALSASTGDILYAAPQAGQRITVRLDNGVAVVITQLQDATLHAGDPVRIEGAGTTARAVRG